jgi:glutathione S-transferase
MNHPIFLHHYPGSPFAEKVRLMLGFKQLAWQSVFQPMVMPKPELIDLTGGYRRIPVLQIGNQVICDTALMADVLEHIAPNPSWYSGAAKGVIRTVAQWADAQLFQAAMAFNFQPAGAQAVFAGAPPEALAAFAADRKAMRNGAERMHPADASSTYKSYLRRLSSMLEGQQFLLGDAPSLADFAAYQSVWHTLNAAKLGDVLNATPLVQAWAQRMASIGHGQFAKSSKEAALAACADVVDAAALLGANDVFQDDHGIALGQAVTVRAESFGPETTAGTLVAATRTRYTLERTTSAGHTVHVHFPRVGYILKAQE